MAHEPDPLDILAADAKRPIGPFDRIATRADEPLSEDLLPTSLAPVPGTGVSA